MIEVDLRLPTVLLVQFQLLLLGYRYPLLCLCIPVWAESLSAIIHLFLVTVLKLELEYLPCPIRVLRQPLINACSDGAIERNNKC